MKGRVERGHVPSSSLTFLMLLRQTYNTELH